MKPELGDRVRDRVSRLEGIITGVTTWLNKCVRVIIQPAVGADGKVPDNYGCDIEQVEVLEKGVYFKRAPATGGPMPTPTQRETPRQ